MNQNIKVTLRYDGSRYDGWQKQGNTKQTIQGKLEAVLEKMTGQAIEVHGSGRTDSGVHALAQTANFYLPETFKEQQDLAFVKEYLNRYLPEDIGVTEIEKAPPRFHSRLNARSKTYLYRIETAQKKDVFERKYCYGLGQPLDVPAMRRAAGMLLGTHDFMGYCSLKKGKKSTVRTLTKLSVETDGTKVLITFEGDGFLHHMARIIAGTLLEAGLHERTPESVTEPLHTKQRSTAGKTAPAEGLFLVKAGYDDDPVPA